MAAQKHITKIISVIMALAVCLCLCAAAFSGKIRTYANESSIGMEYETELFEAQTPLDVNIIMDSADWETMLSNATAEEYSECDVEINGTTFYRVGIRPKGNTSLSSIVSDPTTDRYSFKLEFDKYVDGQTCFGLDKLVLNNNYADATNMKEALVYDLFKYVGADASLCNYAKMSVNGEYWGVYLALEAVEDSFLLRNYGVQSGKLYKPEGMGIGGGKGGFSNGGSGADLNYTDDDLESYSTIWDGEITGSKKADRQRVVTALKNISEGTDLEKYMDIENLVKYMAVHIFSVNEDSLSGMMAHNYYLYETSGKLNLIPWDYNLAFGGMGGGKNATSVVNSAIDNAFSATKFFETLEADEQYDALFHESLEKVVEYINGGEFESFYSRVRGWLDSLVETDPTAFYSFDEYKAAAETLYELVKKRGESIEKQLSGAIPSTSALQKSSDALVDASSLDLSVLGSMGGKNGGFGAQTVNIGKDSEASSKTQESSAQAEGGNEAQTEVSAQNQQNQSNMPEMPNDQNGSPPALPNGEMPSGEFSGGEMPNGAPPDMNGELPSRQEDSTKASSDSTQAGDEGTKVTSDSTSSDEKASESESSQSQESERGKGNAMGGEFFQRGGQMNPPGDGQSNSSSLNKRNLAVYGICLLVMLLFLAFAAVYKRRPGRG